MAGPPGAAAALVHRARGALVGARVTNETNEDVGRRVLIEVIAPTAPASHEPSNVPVHERFFEDEEATFA